MIRAMAGPLEDALHAYDGKDIERLHQIRDVLEPSQARLKEAIALAGYPDLDVARGATWLFKAWLDQGAKCTPATVQWLADHLGTMSDPVVCQHIAQCLGALRVPKVSAPCFAESLERGCGSERPFLRAWAMDGLVRLAEQHPDYRPVADAKVAAGMSDPAASVRARARRILAES